MNTTTETIQHPIQASTFKWVAGGSMAEAIGALATMALAIVGLAGVLSTTLAAIATIVLGAAILVQCGAFGAGVAVSRTVGEAQVESAGLSAEFLGGVTGIVLGILALLDVAPLTLLSVALLAFGASFLLSSSGSIWFNQAGYGTSVSRVGAANNGGQVMIGLGALVLGILAVIGLAQLTLILVGLLSLGAAALFSGSSAGARSYAAVAR